MIMEPFLASPSGPDHVAGFLAALRRACDAAAKEQGVRAAG